MNTRNLVLIAASAGALVLAGCSRNEPATTSQNEAERAVDQTAAAADRAADSAQDAADRAGDAMENAADSATSAAKRAGDTLSDTWDDVADATYDERSQLRASVDNMERSIDAKIEELQARGSTFSADARASWDRGMENLREARKDLRNEINELENATAENWQDAKSDVAEAWRRVRESFTELEARPNS